MAIVQNPITGRSSGKFANAIFQTLVGKNVLRSKPLEVRNPRTPGQVSQRTKFSFAVQFLRAFLPIIRIGFKLKAIGQNAFNACISYNIINSVTGTSPDFAIDYPKLMFARGSLLKASVAVMDENAIDAVSISISENCMFNDPAIDDLAYGVFYNVTKNSILNSMGAKKRSDWSVNITPELWENGDVVHGWVFYCSPDGTEVSDSVYAGSKTLGV